MFTCLQLKTIIQDNISSNKIESDVSYFNFDNDLGKE